MQIQQTLQLIISIISVIGFISTAWLYAKTRVEKSYAAERDFNHIKNSLSQFSEALKMFSQEHDEIQAELKEIKGIAFTFSQRLDFILTRIEINSNFFGRRDQ